MDKKYSTIFNNMVYSTPPKDKYVIVLFQCVKNYGLNKYGDLFCLKCKLIIEDDEGKWIDYYTKKEVPDCFFAVTWADLDESVKYFMKLLDKS